MQIMREHIVRWFTAIERDDEDCVREMLGSALESSAVWKGSDITTVTPTLHCMSPHTTMEFACRACFWGVEPIQTKLFEKPTAGVSLFFRFWPLSGRIR